MATSTYIIRKPQNSTEWDIVKQLLVAYESEFDDKTCFTSFEAELADIENLYAREDRHKLIAVSSIDGTVVGCAAFRALSPGVSEMKRLYVVPGFRGEKLGRMLAEAIISEATLLGYQTMVLDTMMEMKTAQQLYRSLGFEIIPPYNFQESLKVICFGKTLNNNGHT